MEKRYYPAALMTSALAAVITLSFYSLVPVPQKPPATDALRELSAARYLEQVKYLASDEMKGRGDGSPELDKAADYIASQFRLWGLRPEQLFWCCGISPRKRRIEARSIPPSTTLSSTKPSTRNSTAPMESSSLPISITRMKKLGAPLGEQTPTIWEFRQSTPNGRLC